MASSNIRIADGNIYDPRGAVSAEGTVGIQFQSTGSVLLQGGDGTANVYAFYGTNDANHEVAVVGQVSMEASRAESAEASLTAGVSAEASRAESAEASLTAGVSAEASRADASISVEASRAESAEASLTAGVSTEASRAESAELSLSQLGSAAVSTEASRAESAEASLTAGVSAEASRADASISVEASRAESAEASLTAGVSTEASRAESAELSLTFSVSAEASRAESAELSLTFSVSAEASRAEYAEALLTGDLSAEVSRVTAAFTGADGIIFNMHVSAEVQAQAFVTTSDARLKKDVVEVSNALDIVQQIRPVFYNWIDDRNTINPGHQELGFLAQEVEAVLPNVVSTMPNAEGRLDGQKSIAYDRLVSLLVGAIKELNAKVDALSK